MSAITVSRMFSGMVVAPLCDDWDAAGQESSRLLEATAPRGPFYHRLLDLLPEAIDFLVKRFPEKEQEIIETWSPKKILDTWLGV